MKLREVMIRHVYLPVAMGMTEYVADANLPSSQGVTVPMEEFSEGFLVAQAGVLLAIGLYRMICKFKNKQPVNHEETGYAFLGGVVGMIGITAVGLILHEMRGVTDNSWWPR